MDDIKAIVSEKHKDKMKSVQSSYYESVIETTEAKAKGRIDEQSK